MIPEIIQKIRQIFLAFIFLLLTDPSCKLHYLYHFDVHEHIFSYFSIVFRLDLYRYHCIFVEVHLNFQCENKLPMRYKSHFKYHCGFHCTTLQYKPSEILIINSNGNNDLPGKCSNLSFPICIKNVLSEGKWIISFSRNFDIILLIFLYIDFCNKQLWNVKYDYYKYLYI